MTINDVQSSNDWVPNQNPLAKPNDTSTMIAQNVIFFSYNVRWCGRICPRLATGVVYNG